MKNKQTQQLDSLYSEFNVLQKKFMELRHLIETEVQETNLEKAKRLYPKGTKYRALEFKHVIIRYSSGEFEEESSGFIRDIGKENMNYYIYAFEEWAEIITEPKEEKPEFKAGDWVKFTSTLNDNCIFLIDSLEPLGFKSSNYYVLDGNNKEFHGDILVSHLMHGEYTKPTNEEILEVLSWDAKRRGFVEGNKLKLVYEWKIMSDPKFGYDGKKLIALAAYQDLDNGLISPKTSSLTLFCGNQWRFELIKEEPFKIHGYEPKYVGSGFKIGCVTVSNILLDNIKEHNTRNIDHAIKTIILSNGKEITIDQIEKLIELRKQP